MKPLFFIKEIEKNPYLRHMIFFFMYFGCGVAFASNWSLLEKIIGITIFLGVAYITLSYEFQDEEERK